MKNRHIKKVTFKNLKGKPYSLNFKPGINVIIGAKGSGKSLLIKLLWLANNGNITNKISKIYQKFKIELVSIEYSSGEIKEFASFNQVKSKIFNDYAKLDNIITQDDKIKTRLNQVDSIRNECKDFIHDQFKNETSGLIVDIQEALRNINNLKEMFNEVNDISWINQLTSLLEDKTISHITNLDSAQELIPNEKNIIFKNIPKYLKQLINWFEQLLKSKLIDHQGKLSLEEILKSLQLIEMTFAKQSTNFDNYQKISTSFNQSLRKFKQTLSQSKDQEQNLLVDQNLLKKAMANAGEKIALSKQSFAKLMQKPIELKLNAEKYSSDNEFLFKIDSKLKIEQNILIKVFEKYLRLPDRYTNKWYGWVKKLLKEGPKKKWDEHLEFEAKDILIEINPNYVDDYVDIIVNFNKKYKDMSLGQRSIFGIQHKLNKMSSQILFLDQPEDNLDNYSIQKEIVGDLITLAKEKQIFIVTHNANIGINTDPEKIIVANLNEYHKNPEQYKNYQLQEKMITKDIYDEIIDDSPLAHYLEGGRQALIKRFEKMLKGD